jgi:AraC-like DNA-binding protein
MSRRGPRILDAVRAGDAEIARIALSAGTQLPRLALPEIEALLVVSGTVTVGRGRDDTQTIGRGKGIVRHLDAGVRVAATKPTQLLTVRVDRDTASEASWRRLNAGGVDALASLNRALVNGVSPSRVVHGLALLAVARAEATLANAVPAEREPAWMSQVVDRLHDTSTRVSLAELADSVGLTRRQLGTTFRRVHGCSVGEFQRRARIAAACDLMDDPATPLATIATATGFADHAHFTKAFKRVLGMAPSEYRQAALSRNGGRAASAAIQPVGRYTFRSKTAHGEPYDGVITITPSGSSYTGVVQTTVMPDVPIDTIAVRGRRMVLTARVPAGLAILDVEVRGAELEGEWRLTGRPTPVRGRRAR